MDAINKFILDNVAILAMIGLLLVIVLLVVITLLLRRGQTHAMHLAFELPVSLGQQIEQLKQAAEHHADVSAVVTMVRQLDEMDEDAVTLLQSYPESVRAAAWLHCINRLGSDLQEAQQQLSDAHQRKGAYEGYVSDIGRVRQACQQHADNLRAKLDKAIELSGQSGLHAV